ncbi:hypothetical protein [Flaviaesturariibacter amylovorans]|uniref:PepSY domain-containing protein n=1 Tax=Flaviaesturariibacter amylovorans TaxID=1084520 RepID=A0ABP8GY67_9BACT
MKKVLLAGFLLSVGVISANALTAPVQIQMSAPLPKPLQDAFAAYEASLAAEGKVVSNLVWTRVQGKHIANYEIINIETGEGVVTSSTWMSNGNRIN